MEAMKQELKDHDRRITALEAHRESDLKVTNENNKNLATIIKDDDAKDGKVFIYFNEISKKD